MKHSSVALCICLYLLSFKRLYFTSFSDFLNLTDSAVPSHSLIVLRSLSLSTGATLLPLAITSYQFLLHGVSATRSGRQKENKKVKNKKLLR